MVENADSNEVKFVKSNVNWATCSTWFMCNQIMCICKCKCKYSKNRELRLSLIKVLHFSLLTQCDVDTARVTK